MPFPFLPAGAVVAATVLVAALTAFGLILRAMDRGITGLRHSIVPGLVSGLRTWNTRQAERPVPSSPRAVPSAALPTAEIVELGSHPIPPQDHGHR